MTLTPYLPDLPSICGAIVIFLNTSNPYLDLLEDPFCFPRVFFQALDGTMTLSETIELDKGKVLIYRKANPIENPTHKAYAFVVCWDRRLDWDTFTQLYELYEERANLYVDGELEQIEPVLIAKSIDNDVLRFIQQQSNNTPASASPTRTFLF